jgi:hypothetical protein
LADPVEIAGYLDPCALPSAPSAPCIGFCPGYCQPNPAEPGGGTLNDLVVGGTGLFAGAAGNLSGRVFAAGPPWVFQSAIKLSGAITLQT